jgi:acyl-CoA thioesterase-2
MRSNIGNGGASSQTSDGDTMLSPWNGSDITQLLELRSLGGGRFRSLCTHINAHGTVFGGQLLAHAVVAASMGAPEGRDVTALQFTFLQSAQPHVPLDFEVTPLQDGKRFAVRHVRCSQAGGRNIFDAQVSFAIELSGVRHAAPAPDFAFLPEALPPLESMAPEIAEVIWKTLGYPIDSSALDVRLVSRNAGIDEATQTPALRLWMRARRRLPDAPNLHAAAFAYESDWWFNFASVASHVRELRRTGQRLHMASLNHSVWFHRPFRADQWSYFDIESPCADRGRGLSSAKIFDADGILVATASQEALTTFKP